MDGSIRQWINQQAYLTTKVYDNMKSVFEFKADMHHVYIRVRKDLEQTWTTLPFIAIDDDVYIVLDTWLPEWCGLDVVGRDQAAIQKQNATAKSLAQQKQNEQLTEEVRVSQEAVQTATDKSTIGAAATTKANIGVHVTTESEMDTGTEGVEPSTTGAPLK